MLSDRFDSLRITLEAAAEPHALVVVAGGRERDGADVVAHGIARAFAATGVRVALVSGRVQATIDRDVTAVSMASLQSISGARLTERFEKLRADFDVVLFALPNVFERSFDAEITRRSDGVVLTVELGRRVTARDSEIRAMLDRLSTHVFGVVTTNPDLRVQATTVPMSAGRNAAYKTQPGAQIIEKIRA